MSEPEEDADYDRLLERVLDGSLSDDEISSLPAEVARSARAISDGLRSLRQSDTLLKLGETVPTFRPRLARFLVEGEIGRGGQGIVFRGRDPDTGETVALKILPVARQLSSDAVGRLRREQRVLARLEHPGIVRIRDAGEEDGVPWVATDHVEGESLAAWIARRRDDGFTEPLSDLPLLLQYFVGAARAVDAAHGKGIVHRDLKPDNMLIDHQSRAVILDFGLARDLTDEDSGLTRTGDLLGTPAYLAPEQLTRQSITADRRSDVWGLGVCLFEAATGHLPFDEPTRETLFAAILSQEPPNPRRFEPRIGRDLAVVILTALAKDRDHRYSTAGELASELQRCLDRDPIRARPPGPLARLFRTVRRNPMPSAAILLGFLLVGVLSFLSASWADLKLGRRTQAEHRLERALASGYLALGEGTVADAIRSFEGALEVDPRSAEAVAGLILGYQRSGQVDLASQALASGRKSVDDQQSLQALSLLIGDQTAGEALETSGASPYSATARFIAGQAAMTRGHRGDAVAFETACLEFEAAVLLASHARPLYLFELVHAARHCQRDGLLSQLAEDLPRRWPDSPHAWFWAGFYAMEQDDDRAIVAFEMALEIDPELRLAKLDLLHAMN
ncbi:MAG: protein kinase, partial [Planctomycetes bacterium]|nr:protein kinase [Planctomycetota bacterium]